MHIGFRRNQLPSPTYKTKQLSYMDNPAHLTALAGKFLHFAMTPTPTPDFLHFAKFTARREETLPKFLHFDTTCLLTHDFELPTDPSQQATYLLMALN